MKIISEQWAEGGSKTLIVSGYHLNPPKWVVRIHVQNRRAQTIEFESREEMEALLVATSELLLDARTPTTVDVVESIYVNGIGLRPGDIIEEIHHVSGRIEGFKVRRKSE